MNDGMRKSWNKRFKEAALEIETMERNAARLRDELRHEEQRLANARAMLLQSKEVYARELDEEQKRLWPAQ